MPITKEPCECILCGRKTRKLGVYYTAANRTVMPVYDEQGFNYEGVEKKLAPVCLLCRLDPMHHKILWVLGTIFPVGLLVSIIGGINHMDPSLLLPFNMATIISPLCALFLAVFYLEKEPGDLVVKARREIDPDGIYLEREYVELNITEE